jgi:hypothetical protein
MTSTLRCISLLGCLLSVACSERTAPASEPSTLARAAPEAPKKEPPQLTATLPSAPDSIADAPPKPLSTPPAQPTPEPALSDAPDPAHDEPALAHERAVEPADVRIDRFVLAAGVAQREPLGETDVFTTDTKQIYAFVQLANEQEPYAVKVHFEPAEGPASPYGIALAVPTAPRHRTWAFTRIKRAPGRYRAVLRTLDGQEIARREFLVEDMH